MSLDSRTNVPRLMKQRRLLFILNQISNSTMTTSLYSCLPPGTVRYSQANPVRNPTTRVLTTPPTRAALIGVRKRQRCACYTFNHLNSNICPLYEKGRRVGASK